MRSIKISVITINYNNISGLRMTVESVLSQTYSNVEYILIDGDSTDGSKKLLDEVKGRVSYCLSEKDGGIYDAMNKGIAHATGDYCIFMNSGDCFVNKDVLTRTFGGQNYEEDLIVGRQLTIMPSGRRSKSRKIDPKKVDEYFFYSNTLPHQCTFIKTSMLRAVGGYRTDYRIVSDWIFWYEAVVNKKATLKSIDVTIAQMQPGGRSSEIDACHKEMAHFLLEQKKGLTEDDWRKIILIHHKAFKYEEATKSAFARFLVNIAIFMNKK